VTDHDPNTTPNSAFPNLTPDNHRVIGPATSQFNCFVSLTAQPTLLLSLETIAPASTPLSRLFFGQACEILHKVMD
jgi:hypothetical protein